LGVNSPNPWGLSLPPLVICAPSPNLALPLNSKLGSIVANNRWYLVITCGVSLLRDLHNWTADFNETNCHQNGLYLRTATTVWFRACTVWNASTATGGAEVTLRTGHVGSAASVRRRSTGASSSSDSTTLVASHYGTLPHHRVAQADHGDRCCRCRNVRPPDQNGNANT